MEQFRRWSPEELAATKRYLESKPPGSLTREDHWLTTEWLIQRYLPAGEEPTSEQWQKIKAELQSRMDRSLGGIRSKPEKDADFAAWLDQLLAKKSS